MVLRKASQAIQEQGYNRGGDHFYLNGEICAEEAIAWAVYGSYVSFTHCHYDSNAYLRQAVQACEDYLKETTGNLWSLPNWNDSVGRDCAAVVGLFEEVATLLDIKHLRGESNNVGRASSYWFDDCPKNTIYGTDISLAFAYAMPSLKDGDSFSSLVTIMV